MRELIERIMKNIQELEVEVQANVQKKKILNQLLTGYTSLQNEKVQLSKRIKNHQTLGIKTEKLADELMQIQHHATIMESEIKRLKEELLDSETKANELQIMKNTLLIIYNQEQLKILNAQNNIDPNIYTTAGSLNDICGYPNGSDKGPTVVYSPASRKKLFGLFSMENTVNQSQDQSIFTIDDTDPARYIFNEDNSNTKLSNM